MLTLSIRVSAARSRASQAPGSSIAEHGAQDHLERDRLHARAQRERPAERPASRSRARRSRAITSRVARDRSPWNGGQHQLAHAQVLAAVEQQDRARPERSAP